MKNTFFASAAFMALALATQVNAQSVAAPFGHGQDSVNCIQNLSLMGSYYSQGSKSGNFADAVKPWNDVYTKCPASHKSIYIYGPRIVAWQMTQAYSAKKTADAKKYFEVLMGIYDNRIKYFGNDANHPDFYVRGRKAFDYISYSAMGGQNDPLNQTAYEWLKSCIKDGAEENEINVFSQYFLLSQKIYESNKAKYTSQFMEDYISVTDLLASRVEEGNEADSTYDQLKGAIEYEFAVSGAASCSTLDKIYASQISAHFNDADYLNRVLKFYDMADCENSSTYFKASEALYKIKPTYTSAAGLARQSFSKGDFNGAISYMNKAADLTTSRSDKSKIMLNIAALYNKKGQYQQARSYAQKAISYNSANGSAYILIGSLYGSHARAISSDAFVQKSAYWAAVDMFERAKSVDSHCSAQANKLISTYRAYFPSKQECFMRNISGTYHVPGWINVNATVRHK